MDTEPCIDTIEKPLSLIDDYDQYTSALAKYQMGYIVICSVKSNAGAYCNPTKLGIDVPLDTKKNQSFIRIIKDGSVIDQFFDKEPLMIYRHIDNLEIQISSDGYKKDSDGYSHIVINGIDWAVNSRGMNFVTYDTRLKTVVDSVSFDTHMKNCKCIRHPPIDIYNRINDLETIFANKCKSYDAKQQIWVSALSHAIFKTNSEDEIKQLFKNIPPATGDLRTLQLAETKMLSLLIDILEQEQLSYWVFYGTLIGTIRHSGFIPWDDDIDILMPLPDLFKLIQIISKSEELRLVVYSKTYPLFRVLSKRARGPFIDIYACSYSSLDKVEAGKKHEILFKQFVEEYKKLNLEQKYYDSNDEILIKIKDLIEKLDSEAFSTLGSNIKSLTFSPSQREKTVYDIEEIMPLGKSFFEDLIVNIPNNPMSVLIQSYTEVFKLPDDNMFEHNHDSSRHTEAAKQILDYYSNKTR